MNNDVTDSKIVQSVSTPNGGIDRIQVIMAGIFLMMAMIICPSIVLVVYWLEVDDNPPATVNNIIMFSEVGGEAVSTIFVNPGGQIAFSVDFCKFTTSPATIRRTWMNDLSYHVPDGHDEDGHLDGDGHIPEENPMVLAPGCGNQVVVLDVPSTLPASEYMLNTTVIYPVNPIKERLLSFAVGPILVTEDS